MSAKAADGGPGRKKGARKKSERRKARPGGPKTAREKIVRPLREAAARARKLLGRLVGLRGVAARTLRGLRRREARAGDLESLQRIVDALEKRGAAFDMPVDFSPLRRRLDALLSVLLEIGDDRLAATAARPLAAELAVVLHRAETLFLLPDALYRALDPESAGLAPLREACEAEAFDQARAALLDHLRAKEHPEALASWLLHCSDRCRTEAELVVRGFCRAGPGPEGRPGARPWRFVGAPLRWEYLRSPEPHEHDETAVLARAYAATGNEAFATEAVVRLLAWAASTPPAEADPAGGAVHPAGRAPGAWAADVAARRLLNFGACLLALRASRAFTPEAARVFLVLARETAEHLRHADAGGAAAGAALAVAGALFDEFAAAREWRERGERFLERAAEEDVLADGGCASRSLAGHALSLDSFVAGALAGGPASPAREAARRMTAFEKVLLVPGGGPPLDHDPGAARERLARLDLAASLLGIREEPAAGADFHAFEQSGLYVMRTGGGEDAGRLVLRPGGTRGLHVACAGRKVLADPAPPLGAGEETGPPVSPEPEGPRSVVFRAGPPCDYVRVVSGAGGATRRREVLFFERRWWALADRVRSAGGACALEFALEPAPEHASSDGRRFVSGGLLVALAGPTDTGFRFESDEHGGAVARAESAGPDVSFVALLYPLRGEDPEAISVEPVAAEGGRVAGFVLRHEGEARTGLVAFPHGERTEEPAVPETAQAAALARAEARWRTIFSAD